MAQANSVKNCLLSVEQMYEADRRTIASGTTGLALMEAAGSAITREILKKWSPRKTVILCGPGNNGGDGFVVARLLHQKGWNVRVLLLGTRDKLTGDARTNAERWPFDVQPLCPQNLTNAQLIVDAIFGAGLARDIDGIVAETLCAARNLDVPIVAVDTPSGIDGNTGEIRGTAIPADLTVTFARPKTGHLLLPARQYCGDLIVADIGIRDETLTEIAPNAFNNDPAHLFPWPKQDTHKFMRGHGVIIGGKKMTGATRLAATCARRIGLGLVTISAHATAYMIYRQAEPGNIVSDSSLSDHLADPRKNVFLVGPGLGLGEKQADIVQELLNSDKKLVLDADALTLMADSGTVPRPYETLLTPHEGEFSRLFPTLKGSKLHRARQAAIQTGYVVLLKGPDTVIASPCGKAVINTTGTAWLATAGSGDSLAGFCLGLMGQGLSAFDAGCLAAWLHGKCAETFGPGLISEDIANVLPQVIQSLQK